MNEIEKIGDLLIKIEHSKKIINLPSLRKRVDKLQTGWRFSDKLKSRINTQNQIKEILHELICIIKFTQDSDCLSIIYEEKLLNIGTSIDLKIKYKSGTIYADIKTIHPNQNIKKALPIDIIGNIFYEDPSGNNSKNGGKTNFAHKAIATRGNFVKNTYDIERKIEQLNNPDHVYIIIFCGNNFDWHHDELEDWSFFYKTKKFLSYGQDQWSESIKRLTQKYPITHNLIDNFYSLLPADDGNYELINANYKDL